MTKDIMEYFIKCSNQRAALWGTISALLNDEQSESVEDIKRRVANNISRMIDRDIMISDEIEMMVCKDALKFLEQEEALEEIKNILNPKND